MVRIPFPRQHYAVATLLVLVAIVVGCQPIGRRPLSIRASLAPVEPPCLVPPGVTLCNATGTEAGLRPQRNVLALSSGGLYGAYSTGFLAGWTKTGTRPEFDTVTGVSVGSLIAPYAFLGAEYDGVAMSLHTGVRAEDVFRIRAWVTIPFKDAVASSNPLKKLIESQITVDLLRRISEEHAKGRRLYVATTNLSTRRLVVWDMGVIAGLANGAALFRDVLLASCSVPGMFPPVMFAVPGEDGLPVNELHADGGITSQLFMPSQVFQAAIGNAAGVPVVPGATGNFYAVVAGKLYADASPVRQRVLPILGATTESIMYANCRAELGNLHGHAVLAGMRFHLASLRQDLAVNAETLISIDQGEMQKLYVEGEQDGRAGPSWQFAPPDLCAPAPVFVRGSSRPHKR
ncbi:MAG: patatin-like phospholipase family protein [Planctomycetes bacterium]|nr:patatin-like phospholipase family protein [Planctomycetota bacterium]